MKFHLLFVNEIAASFELDNESIFYAPTPYDVLLDGRKVISKWERNVFSLYGLEPNRTYEVSIESDVVSFSTKKAALIAHLKDFPKAVSPADDTLRIQTALDVLPPHSVLWFDEGTYEVTSLFLRNDLTLYLPKETTVLGNPEVSAYPMFPGEILGNDGEMVQLMTFEGAPQKGMPSLFNGFGIHGVSIVGEGLVDMRADKSHFWDDVKHLTYARPHVFFFNRCEDISLLGLSIQNSPCWTIHPYFSKNLGFYDLYLSNPKDTPNTDGINPQCCSDVSIIGVRFSVGDDCIALKSGKIYIGKTYKTPTERVTIRNCYMHEGHGAIVLGSEAGAGLKDITVERCFFEGTDRGMRIKSRRGRGRDSVIDGIAFRNIKMKDVLTPLVVNMFYFCDPDGKDDWVQDKNKHPVDETTPYLGSFTFDHLDCEDASVALGFFYGLPEQLIGSIHISNSRFSMKKDASEGYPAMMCGVGEMKKKGFLFTNVKNVRLENVVASGYEGEEETLVGVKSFKKT